MHRELIPLFPLQAVLLPRAALPLHIFEDRYKLMFAEVLRAESEFGVVLARENGVLDIGCKAGVERIVRQYEDGRLDLVASGRRRFKLLELDNERAYMRGRVEELDDTDPAPAPPQRAQAALALYRQYTDSTGVEQAELEDDDPELSFVLGAASPDLEFRQGLLGVLSEAQRIELLTVHFAQLIQRHTTREATLQVAGKNGRAKHWKG